MFDILLIEDNLELAQMIKTLFQEKGFSLCHFKSGEEALLFLNSNKVKLILLDIMLENMDGFAVCKKIRESKTLPILILSAQTFKQSQLLGFELGADDYIEKPIDFDILLAKVNVQMKRNFKDQNVLVTGDFKVDFNAHKVFLKNNLLDLNNKEYELLVLFLKNPDKTLYKNYIFNEIWGMDSFSEEQTLTVHIKMLRDKIEEDSRNPQKIITVWGVGYRYEEN